MWHKALQQMPSWRTGRGTTVACMRHCRQRPCCVCAVAALHSMPLSEGHRGSPSHHQQCRAMAQEGGAVPGDSSRATPQGPRWATWTTAVRQLRVRHPPQGLKKLKKLKNCQGLKSFPPATQALMALGPYLARTECSKHPKVQMMT